MTFPWTVDSDESGMRLDQVLARRFPETSRSQWARRVEAGRLLVDGNVVAPSSKLREGQVVSEAPQAPRPAREAVRFEGSEPRVLHEDNDVIVIDKPEGLTVHAGAGVATPKTLVGWLLATGRIAPEAAPGEGDESDERPGIVHRLDRGTSGVMVVAKNPRAHAHLASQFGARTAGRLYWAVIEGRVRTLFQKRPVQLEKQLHRQPPSCALRLVEDGICSFASQLARDPADRTRFRVSSSGGKKALTHFVEVDSNDRYSLLELKLSTGRTHQIRVHLSFLGFPIVGDGLYGGRGHERVLLHAHTLEFAHPADGRRLRFSAPWPAREAAWLTAKGLEAQSRDSLWQVFQAREATLDLSSTSSRDGHED